MLEIQNAQNMIFSKWFSSYYLVLQGVGFLTLKEMSYFFSIARSTYLEPVPSLEVRGLCFLSK